MNTCPRGHFHLPLTFFKRKRRIKCQDEGNSFRMERLSNGGVIESKIWPTLISSNRAVFPISTLALKSISDI